MFDGEELLESSIRVIRHCVEHVVVVYQTVSNFGNPCRKGLERLLQVLVDRGIVNEIVHYDPSVEISVEEKRELVAADANPDDIGGSVEAVGEQFFHELRKREMGRRRCQAAGCSHFMSMDTDEFYLPEQLERAKEMCATGGYDVTACRMRLYFKAPYYEYLPVDSVNAVTLICRLDDAMPLRLVAGRYPVLVDPTRRTTGWGSFHLFERADVEMHHYSFVRLDISSKLANVSNKGNYRADLRAFLQQFEAWKPSHGVLHPHPNIGKQFTHVQVRDDPFNIHLDLICSFCCALSVHRCSRCKSAVYCSLECQHLDWSFHSISCLQEK
ncbi:MAG: zinc finger MYND domain-containing protein [archaeon]|nr:zinc finger MYND domain-containing protein [archaeon]